MNTKAIRLYKATLALTGRQRELLAGMLLGDAHLEAQGKVSARLKVEHSLAQLDYTKWKFREFWEWVRTPPRTRWKSNQKGTTSLNVGFSTLSHPELGALRRTFYPNGRKAVPETLELTPLTVAVWFMDDGSRKSRECRGLYLNTQSFLASEVVRLQWRLRQDLGVLSTLREQSEGTQIYIPSRETSRFIAQIGPHMIVSMRYKLPG